MYFFNGHRRVECVPYLVSPMFLWMAEVFHVDDISVWATPVLCPMASLVVVIPVLYVVLNSLMIAELSAKHFASLFCSSYWWLALEWTVDPFCRTESNSLVLLMLKLLLVWILMPLLIYPLGTPIDVVWWTQVCPCAPIPLKDTVTCFVVAVYPTVRDERQK